MNITTKFKIGDKVFRLSKYTLHQLIECSICHDSKQVEISGAKYKCPACADGSIKHFERWYAHDAPTTIGNVRVEVTLKSLHSCNYFDEGEIQGDEGVIKEQYMLAATGIGSGTLWGAQDLFSDLTEANSECESRNRDLEAQENALPK